MPFASRNVNRAIFRDAARHGSALDLLNLTERERWDGHALGALYEIPRRENIGQVETKKNHDCSWFFLYSGSPTWTRTRDLRINSPSLYQLSYQGKEATLYIPETALSNF